MDNSKNLHLDTKAIHAGQSPEPITGAVMTPVLQPLNMSDMAM